MAEVEGTANSLVLPSLPHSLPGSRASAFANFFFKCGGQFSWTTPAMWVVSRWLLASWQMAPEHASVLADWSATASMTFPIAGCGSGAEPPCQLLLLAALWLLDRGGLVALSKRLVAPLGVRLGRPGLPRPEVWERGKSNWMGRWSWVWGGFFLREKFIFESEMLDPLEWIFFVAFTNGVWGWGAEKKRQRFNVSLSSYLCSHVLAHFRFLYLILLCGTLSCPSLHITH